MTQSSPSVGTTLVSCHHAETRPTLTAKAPRGCVTAIPAPLGARSDRAQTGLRRSIREWIRRVLPGEPQVHTCLTRETLASCEHGQHMKRVRATVNFLAKRRAGKTK